MPLTWNWERNCYRVNYFSILGLGANATRQQIVGRRHNLEQALKLGGTHRVGEQEITLSEVTEAAARLLDERSWAAELLLVHPMPSREMNRVHGICRTVLLRASPPAARPFLPLSDLGALAGLLPEVSGEDIAWPEWEEFEIPGPDSEVFRRLDFQFDL